MASITIGLLLKEQVENSNTVCSILDKLMPTKALTFFEAYIYNELLDESEKVDSLEDWIFLSQKYGSYNQCVFKSDSVTLEVQRVGIDDKIGYEIVIPYEIFAQVYELKKYKLNKIEQLLLNLFEIQPYEYVFVDFDENLELTKEDFEMQKLSENQCYLMLAILEKNKKLLSFSSGKIL